MGVFHLTLLLRPFGRRAIPAVHTQLFDQIGGQFVTVAGGDVGFDMLELAHAGDDAADGVLDIRSVINISVDAKLPKRYLESAMSRIITARRNRRKIRVKARSAFRSMRESVEM